jgi:hypothetical protein
LYNTISFFVLVSSNLEPFNDNAVTVCIEFGDFSFSDPAYNPSYSAYSSSNFFGFGAGCGWVVAGAGLGMGSELVIGALFAS